MARRIRAFRKLKGLTQQQLADLLQLSVAVLGEMERGNRNVDTKTVLKLSQVLNVSEEELTFRQIRP
ncbi:helix-turn-helix domain-containing protein [Paenibacillus sp. 481]|uniref:helix-turn-helix domain-containing protein n=1 Tax=Paenibacillus sp. 481 TaxID=2835869 RepID=UPI001E31B2B6|nr:helix-turn-helix transcriptional regulator [Paenibacillus sp. 481]